MKDKILITGGTGFIGKNLSEYFSDKYEVITPSRSELDLLDPVSTEAYLKTNKVKYVLHCASTRCHRGIPEAENVAFKNLKMFFNLARSSKLFKKMIFFGSGAEFDIRHNISNVKEIDLDKNMPEDEYGFSKYACTKFIENSDNILNLRIFGCFGKNEEYQVRFISNNICKALFGLPITMKQNRLFSYLYIDDLCRMVEYFLKNKTGHKVFNIVPIEKNDLISLAEMIKKISGKNLPINIANKGMGREYTASNSRLLKEIKGLQFTPTSKAVEMLYNWYKNNIDKIDKQLLIKDV